jgi:hypothetical protein
VVCNAETQWNLQPSVPANRREGRLQRRRRCGLEKSAMPSLLTSSANQHNPTLRVGLYPLVKNDALKVRLLREGLQKWYSTRTFF